MVAVNEGMHAQDAGRQSRRGSCVVKDGLHRTEVPDAAIERCADRSEIPADRVRRNSFQLPHPAVRQ